MKMKINLITVITALFLSACSGSQISDLMNTLNETTNGTKSTMIGQNADRSVSTFNNANDEKDILIRASDYSILGIDDNYFDEFATPETVDEQNLQLLELPGSEYDKAITYEDYLNGRSPDNNLILIKNYKDDDIRIYGTLTDNSNELIIEHKGKRKAFPVGWGAGYKDPVICLLDYDGDGVRELVLSAMAWHGTGLYRDGLYVFELGDDITLSKMEMRDITDQLSHLISLDFDRQAVVQNDGFDIIADIPFRTYIDEYSENRTDKEQPNTDYVIQKLDIVSFWEIDVNNGSVLLKVTPCLFINGDDYTDYACPYDKDLEDSRAFSFKVLYDGKGFKLSPDRTVDNIKGDIEESKQDIIEQYKRKGLRLENL